MGKSVDEIVCINKDLYNKILLITNSNLDQAIDENLENYLISKSLYEQTKNIFINMLKNSLRENLECIKGASLSKYNALKDEYQIMIYTPIAEKANNEKVDKLNEEELLDIQIRLYQEIENIKKIPGLINEIIEELKQLKSDMFKEYKSKLNNFIKNGASFEEYIGLKNEIDKIIKQTYIDAINTDVYGNKKIYLVKNNGKYKFLDVANLNGFTFGYIYSPESIIKVTNENNQSFVNYNNINYENDLIVTDESKPIGIYAVTYGEGSISLNYQKAMNLYSTYGLPFIEFDKTFTMNIKNYCIDELINNLIIDKGLGLTIDSQNEQIDYSSYMPFFKRFMALKEGKYSEGNVINLFNFYFDFINSQSYLNLDNVLSYNSRELIKEILECNKFFDFNIFKTDGINIEKLNTFINTFYPYRDNKELNIIYKGISPILNELYNATESKKLEVVNLINSSPCKDSWFLATKIVPPYRLLDERRAKVDPLPVTFVSSGNEETVYDEYLGFLKSNDGFAR